MESPVEQAGSRPRRQRPRPPHSPGVMSATTTTTDDVASGTEESASSLLRQDPQLAAVLGGLPSSSKELLRRIERQQDEIRVLQEENTRLRAREVEVSALTLRLQQQFGATQSQVDRLKSQVRMELMNPITEEEYTAIESLEEGKRDLLDTVKLGIYQQLGSMRAAKDAAMRRSTEMATETTRLTRENRELQQRLKELEAVVEAERQSFRRQLQEVEQRGSGVVELEGKVRDLESRLKNAYVDQEQFLTAKLNASVKTEEATRLGVRLREAEMEAERYKTVAECSEQKLDILKSEYYELKLKNSQRVLELEACLKGAEEKLKTLSDLELESELFVSNLAMQSGGQMALTAAPTFASAAGDDGAPAAASAAPSLSNYESWLALPRSRKLAHALTVTKRCLQLENRLSVLQHDVEFKDKQIARLQASLDMAREALNNSNSPFAMVERTVERLTRENEELHDKTVSLSEENALLRQRLEQRTADVQVLCGHRKELLRIQRVLRRLGLEGKVADPAAASRSQGPQQPPWPPQQQQQQREMDDALDPHSSSIRSFGLRRDQTAESPLSFSRHQADELLHMGKEPETASATEGQQRQARQQTQELEKSSSGVLVPRPIQIIS
ncbi:uncharacterized protein Tco025E_09412 [Trypanosoma conorhini]|uniref:Uncharacterized protein n=1 Tax=Trypanosoma conorhini TaxID=83891 RepID=A0A422MWH6_9TRYP|nr:uncharacterized protein Tco025E_09412 [Trypanosoma conorhini]RNE97588.1 hypothetical protein Tco025E_09412 [Trypanosoma conorhini]